MKDIVIFAGSIGNTYSIVKSVTKRIKTRILIVFVNENTHLFLDIIDWYMIPKIGKLILLKLFKRK